MSGGNKEILSYLHPNYLQVETRLPVEICRRKRFGESSIFLSRGDVMRKEGPPKRRRIFQRQLKGNEGIFEQLSNNNFTQLAKEEAAPK